MVHARDVVVRLHAEQGLGSHRGRQLPHLPLHVRLQPVPPLPELSGRHFGHGLSVLFEERAMKPGLHQPAMHQVTRHRAGCQAVVYHPAHGLEGGHVPPGPRVASHQDFAVEIGMRPQADQNRPYRHGADIAVGGGLPFWANEVAPKTKRPAERPAATRTAPAEAPVGGMQGPGGSRSSSALVVAVCPRRRCKVLSPQPSRMCGPSRWASCGRTRRLSSRWCSKGFGHYMANAKYNTTWQVQINRQVRRVRSTSGGQCTPLLET